jgi:murein L,D-transpeptidase YcbB/YkuD
VIAGQQMQTALSGGDLASLPADRGHNSTWSPDGRQLAWTQSEGDNLTLTTTVVLSTGERQRTLATLHFALNEPFQGEARRYDQAQPTWLPDGSGLLLAAQTTEAQSSGTWLVRLDGTTMRLSPHTLCDLAPDGQRMLARTQAGMIVVVKLADGTIESELGAGESAAWRPPHSGAAPAAPLAAKSPQLALATPPIQGEAVQELQQQLKELGYDPGASDGIYGEQTASAVRRFQEAMGLDVDGIVGPQTWSWLRAQMWRLWLTHQLPPS